MCVMFKEILWFAERKMHRLRLNSGFSNLLGYKLWVISVSVYFVDAYKDTLLT